eukprot:710412-Prymnesium_polylepis.1
MGGSFSFCSFSGSSITSSSGRVVAAVGRRRAVCDGRCQWRRAATAFARDCRGGAACGQRVCAAVADPPTVLQVLATCPTTTTTCSTTWPTRLGALAPSPLGAGLAAYRLTAWSADGRAPWRGGSAFGLALSRRPPGARRVRTRLLRTSRSHESLPLPHGAP